MAAVLGVTLLFGSGLTEGTRFEWISTVFRKAGPLVAGLVLSEGIHSEFGLAFMGLLIGVDFLIAWMIALLMIEVLMKVVPKGMHRE